MIITFRGATWGAYGDEVQVLAAPGLEDWASDAPGAALSGDGSSVGRLRLRPKEFVLDLLVLAGTNAAMATELDAIRALTFPEDDRTKTYPLGFTVTGQSERFVFARCVQQQIPTEFETNDRYRAARCQFAFVADDPQTYGAATTVELDPAETLAITGTIPSQEGRIRAVIEGPVTNPQIASSLATSAKIRYVGSVASGSNLVLDWSPGYLLTKKVTDAQLATAETYGVGTNVYADLDGGSGSNRPPQWFPLTYGAQTLTYTTSSGAGVCNLTYRVPKP